MYPPQPNQNQVMKIMSNPKLLFIALFLILTNKVHSQDDFSFFTFESFGSNPSTDQTYQGDARVLPGSTILSLAGTEPSGEAKKESVGRVLYSKPVTFWANYPTNRQNLFETTIKFAIKPSKNGAAEGLAFFIAPVKTTIPEGSVGGNLGIYNGGTVPSLFAVEFDTNYNAWDPDYHHIGINIGSRTSKNVTKFNAGTGEVVTMQIKFHPSNRIISVVASSASQTAELSYVFDLKSVLPKEVQVGITSSTGVYITGVGIPNIISWDFFSLLVYDNVNYDETYIRQAADV